MKKIIIFNWKMAPNSLKEAKKLFNSILKETKNIEIIVAPPFVYLPFFNIGKFDLLKIKRNNIRRSNFQNVKLAAQNCFWEPRGAYTGEIAATMLKDLGVEYVIIGHSERRQYLKETDEMINKKVLAALKAGLKVVLCVGEDLAIRKRGRKAVENYVKNQLEKDLKNSKFLILNSKLRNHLVIAYEPVWAISTSKSGHSDTPQDALEMIKFIKELLNVKCQMSNVRVIYGGSVDSKNIKNFVKYPEIDGALVGGASLKKDEIRKILNIIKK